VDVDGYLARLRRRAATFYGVRAVLLGGGVATLAGGLLAVLVGAATVPWVAVGAWAAVLASGGLAGAFGLRGAARIRGDGAARLLASVDEGLASAARSAVQLRRDAGANAAAPELVSAHAAQVREVLALVPPERVVPLRWLRHAAVPVGALALVAGLFLLRGTDRGAAGAWALFHPGQKDEAGIAVASIVDSVEAELTYPAYAHRTPLALSGVVTIEAIRGTSVEVRARTRVEVSGGVLELGETRVRLSPDGSDGLRGRFVVRDDARLRIRVRDGDGRWLRDPGEWTVRALADLPPRVTITSPDTDVTAELRDAVSLHWKAVDDIGLRTADLVVVAPGGRQVRRRLVWDEEAAQVEAAGEASIVAAAFGARPGDELTLWVEARDGDDVSGPNQGRSVVRTIRVASEATRRSEALAGLSSVLGLGLDALADRLESHIGQDGPSAAARFERISASSGAFADALSVTSAEIAGATGATADPSLLAEMSRRIRRMLTREGRLTRPRLAAATRRTTADAEAVAELERDALLLADMLTRAQIGDAAAIARELEDLRRQMASLLAELARADSPEARQSLMEAIARAQTRMRDLMRRVAEMSRDVPQDFINTDSFDPATAEDALASLRRAVDEGNLEEAQRQLLALERQIDSLAQALGAGAEAFEQARFGPRERALAEAMDALAGLEAEQQRLAERSVNVRRQAAERALAQDGSRRGESMQDLLQRAGAARRALEAVAATGGAPVDDEAFGRARQRMTDVEDSLRTGDLGEARQMADEATGDLSALARDLDLSALMFPGARGETADAARLARDASRQLAELRREMDRAVPRVGDYLDERGRAQMHEDVAGQRAAEQAAGELAERFAQGPDEAPLLPDAAREVEEAARSMAEGRRGLERRDPVSASNGQEEAARRLTELRERIERERERTRDSGGNDGEMDGTTASGFQEPVRIPGAEEFAGPMELRRRLLDAMREGVPPGYEAAVRRYYEELLR